jgi:long-chain acyl-CoA synthetase|nr:MAG: long-chain-fatty-acid--CoA ligase [Bacteroidota bacterium]
MQEVHVPDRPWYRFYEPGVPRTIAYPEVPLWKFLEESARKYPAHTALIFFGKRIAYGELWEAVERFAHALEQLGVRKGDRVALMLPNSPQFVIAFYGALRIGATVVGLNPLYTARELAFMLNDSLASTLVVLRPMFPRYREVADSTPVQRVIVTGVEDYLPWPKNWLYPLKARREGSWVEVSPTATIHLFRSVLERHPPRPSSVSIDPREDVALLLYTGGTTGTPKAAMLTHFNLVANCLQVKSWMPSLQEGREVIQGVLPFFHSYGLTAVLNLGMAIAATVVLQPRFVLEEVLKSTQRYRVTLFPGVPTMYVAINTSELSRRYNLRSVRLCISGAAPLPVEVAQQFERITGARLVEGYGLSEASPVTHTNPLFGQRKFGSIGIPLPDVDAQIVDEEGKPLPPGEVGELIVRGPNVMKGYWNRPEETARALRDGWLYTGDMARMDEEGYFYIVDRKKDMIIVGGFNVFPREVEEVLFEHPKIKEAVVVGVPDPYHGEIVKAYVVLRSGEQATEQEIIEFCRERLASYKVPRQVEFRADLPKSMVGKVLRRVLLEEERQRMAGNT